MTRMRSLFAEGNRTLWIIGAIAFLVGGLAAAPASLLASIAKAGDPSLEIGAAEGTVWRGAFVDAAHDGIYLGRISYRLNPIGLLSGRLLSDAEASGGALSGRGKISIGRNAIELVGVDARFNLAAIRRYTIFGLRYQGAASFRAEKVILSKNKCEVAGVEIATNALDPLARKWSGEGLPLKGGAHCADGALVLTLAGENREGSVTLEATVAPDLNYAMTVKAAPRRKELSAALRAAGFEGDNDALAFRAAGRLKGLTS